MIKKHGGFFAFKWLSLRGKNIARNQTYFRDGGSGLVLRVDAKMLDGLFQSPKLHTIEMTGWGGSDVESVDIEKC